MQVRLSMFKANPIVFMKSTFYPAIEANKSKVRIL